jgi:hypothetical protein
MDNLYNDEFRNFYLPNKGLPDSPEREQYTRGGGNI